MKKNSLEQPNLFDLNQNDLTSNPLKVVLAEFKETYTTNWEDLFSGFDDLKVITFSSGIQFINRLMKMYKNVEIIFGNEDIISNGLNDVLAYQTLLKKEIISNDSKYNLFKNRIKDGSVHLYVSRYKLSHEKIYLLSSQDGRKRVITGSANMSYQAFNNMQRENILIFDDNEAYEHYLNVYNELIEYSVDEISYKALINTDNENFIENSPIAEHAKKDKILIIEPSISNEEYPNLVLNTRALANEIKPFLPNQKSNSHRIEVTSNDFKKISTKYQNSKEILKNEREEYPELIVDLSKRKVTLNDNELNLYPNKDDINRDVSLFLKYMDGYNEFHGEAVELQQRYYEFFNWVFCSVFMPFMRYAALTNDRNPMSYPVFGIIYGQSKAGKTSFVKTIEKMMIGQKPMLSATEFTRSNIIGLKSKVKGVPILVDDLTQKRFSDHAIEVIKYDEFGISDNNQNYPSVIISANNDIKAINPEIVRRCVICRAEAGLTNTQTIKNNIVEKTQKNIGTALFREYLRKMLEILPDLIDKLKDDSYEAVPDILLYSSKILKEIITENIDNELPSYIRDLSLEDYFSERVTGKHVIKTINQAWKYNKNNFEIKKKDNTLIYNAGDIYEARNLYKECPEDLNANVLSTKITMKLDSASDFFGISFKKSFFDKFK